MNAVGYETNGMVGFRYSLDQFLCFEAMALLLCACI